jgi:hypothetical protein
MIKEMIDTCFAINTNYPETSDSVNLTEFFMSSRAKGCLRIDFKILVFRYLQNSLIRRQEKNKCPSVKIVVKKQSP